MNKLAIVVPCYNEQEILDTTCNELRKILKDLVDKNKIDDNSFILFVDDGSTDNTWNVIQKSNAKYKNVFGLKLSADVGHQNALLAGMLTVKELCDMVITIDADLQDDILAIEKMVDKYLNGIDIVYGVRSSRVKDSFLKRTSAQAYYKLMTALGANCVYNHADFRLMSKRAVDEFSKYGESNLYIRGIIPLMGYPTDSVYYERKERTAGESKYTFKKLFKLASDGITSSSVKPINMVGILGTLIVVCSIMAAIYTIVLTVVYDANTSWMALIVSFWFIGGVQLSCIGLIGQYIGKIYMEVKKRPRYHMEQFLDNKCE